MRSYRDIKILAAILLEDSYVLDIMVRPGSITFTMDFALLPGHEQYETPAPGIYQCYRRGSLCFAGVKSCLWTKQGSLPARDATGEVDFGNIDSFEWNDSGMTLEGDWGHMELVSDHMRVAFS